MKVCTRLNFSSSSFCKLYLLFHPILIETSEFVSVGHYFPPLCYLTEGQATALFPDCIIMLQHVVFQLCQDVFVTFTDFLVKYGWMCFYRSYKEPFECFSFSGFFGAKSYITGSLVLFFFPMVCYMGFYFWHLSMPLALFPLSTFLPFLSLTERRMFFFLVLFHKQSCILIHHHRSDFSYASCSSSPLYFFWMLCE